MSKVTKVLTLLLTSLACAHAVAFDMAECVSVSQLAPYRMDTEAAREACEAKRVASGEATINDALGLYKTVQPDVDGKEIRRRMFHYTKGEYMRISACLGWCVGSEHYARCPEGYSIVKEAAGPRRHGGYHGRYPVRGGMCLKDGQ